VIGDGVTASRAGVNGELLSNISLVLAVIALVIGGIGVMNTMLMAVIERRTEFALLSAVGWSGPQIATRVIIEGVMTTILSVALGLLLGIVGAHLLVSVLGAQESVSRRAARVSPAQVLAER
jgi:putative ABC transport system permease protein